MYKPNEPKTYTVEISVEGDQVKLEPIPRLFVDRRDKIVWECESPFAIHFPGIRLLGKGRIRSKKKKSLSPPQFEMMLSQGAINILLPLKKTARSGLTILSLLSNLQKDKDKRCLGCLSVKDTLTEFKPAFQGRGIEIHWSSKYAFCF